MLKCDMCYDRTAADLKPMCATVCPSGALFYGTREEVAHKRREKPINTFTFGRQLVKTKVHLMVGPTVTDALEFDVANFIDTISSPAPANLLCGPAADEEVPSL